MITKKFTYSSWQGTSIGEKKEELSAEDEWAHITGAGAGEKIEATDAMDVQDRSITFKKELNENATNYEFYEEEKDRMKDQVGNTAQYIKFVNESIKEKKNRLDELAKQQQKFQEDIESLQFDKPKTKEQLDNIKYKDIKLRDVNQTIEFLQQERDQIRKKMEHFASQVSRAQTDLVAKDKQIAQIKAEREIIQKREINQKAADDPLVAIKKQLAQLNKSGSNPEILSTIEELVAKMSKEKNQ